MTNTSRLDEIMGYLQLEFKKPVASGIREEVIALGDGIVMAKAKEQIKLLFLEVIDKAASNDADAFYLELKKLVEAL